MIFLFPHTGTRFDDFLPVGMLAVFLVAIGISAVVIITDSNGTRARYEEQRELWHGASVAKICRSGARIYKLKDGTFSDGRWPVGGPSVCE